MICAALPSHTSFTTSYLQHQLKTASRCPTSAATLQCINGRDLPGTACCTRDPAALAKTAWGWDLRCTIQALPNAAAARVPAEYWPAASPASVPVLCAQDPLKRYQPLRTLGTLQVSSGSCTRRRRLAGKRKSATCPQASLRPVQVQVQVQVQCRQVPQFRSPLLLLCLAPGWRSSHTQ